jgi:hypothetical protein
MTAEINANLKDIKDTGAMVPIPIKATQTHFLGKEKV